MKKKWTGAELEALFALEKPDEVRILPVLHGLKHDDVAKYSPIIAGRVASDTENGLESVIADLKRAHKKHS